LPAASGVRRRCPPLVLALIIVALAAGQIWMVRTQLINALYRRAAVPIISLSILAVGGSFALIGYAFVRTALGTFPVSN